MRRSTFCSREGHWCVRWYPGPSASCSSANRAANTMYQFAEMGVYCYYYAHLDGYGHVTRYGQSGNLLEESQRERSTAALEICPATLPVASLPPLPCGVVLPDTRPVMPLVSGLATRRCPRPFAADVPQPGNQSNDLAGKYPPLSCFGEACASSFRALPPVCCRGKREGPAVGTGPPKWPHPPPPLTRLLDVTCQNRV